MVTSLTKITFSTNVDLHVKVGKQKFLGQTDQEKV